MPDINSTSIKETFLSTVDRRLATLGALLSLISLFVSIFVVSVDAPTFIVVRDLLIVASGLALFATLLTKYIRREALIRELERRVLNQQSHFEPFRNAHEMVHNYKETVFGRFFDRARQDTDYSLSVTEKRAFNNLCSLLTVGVRTSFIRYFHGLGIDISDDVAVSVKTIVPSSEIARWELSDDEREIIESRPRWLITAYRDPTTFALHRERETGANCYDIHQNTAFRIVIEEGEEYYAQNDLESLGIAYKNANPDWQKHYNATLVVPIQFRDAARGIKKYYGVLTVDSMNEERRDLFNAGCVPILCHAADLLATFFLLLELRIGAPQAQDQHRPNAATRSVGVRRMRSG